MSTIFLLLLAFSASLLVLCQGHEEDRQKLGRKCGFAHFRNKSFSISNQEQTGLTEATLLQQSLDETTFEPLRIYFDLSNVEAHKDKKLVEYLKKKYFPACGNYFRKVLKVFPVKENLLLDGNECETQNELLVKSGITGYDLVIVVRLEDKPNEEYLAAAAHCQLDSRYHNRPVAGVMVLNTAYLKPNHKEDWLSHFTTCIHELNHVLGFNPDLFPYFIDRNGQVLGSDNVVRQANYGKISHPVENSSDGTFLGGKNLDLLVMEPIKRAARNYFGCPTLEGFALEANDTNPTVPRGHFNPNWILNELMAPRDQDGTVISVFTFAFLEGTGWYFPDYTYAEQATHGYNLGCSFLSESCQMSHVKHPANGKTSSNSTLFYEFCESLGASGCFIDYNYKGNCVVDPAAAPCNYIIRDGTGACFDTSTPADLNRGEQPSLTSKCILGTLHKTSDQDSFTGRCYKTECIR